MGSDKHCYMELLHSSINRYSQNSVVLKSLFIALFCAFIAICVNASYFWYKNIIIFVLFGIALLTLSFFDLTQCTMERKCIFRYNEVRKDSIEIDFELNPRDFSETNFSIFYVLLKMQYGLFYFIFFLLYIASIAVLVFPELICVYIIVPSMFILLIVFLIIRKVYKARKGF